MQFLRPTLHTFDLWADRWRRREATGNMVMVRYADDIIIGFEHETDARRFWDEMRARMRAKLQEIKEAVLRQRHQPIPIQGEWLRKVVAGFCAYHAVPTNGPALSAFRYRVITFWHKALRRRSQKDNMTWARMTKLANDWLPMPRILHPWPSERFAVKHPRWEPDARIGRVRFCAGDAQK